MHCIPLMPLADGAREDPPMSRVSGHNDTTDNPVSGGAQYVRQLHYGQLPKTVPPVP